MVHITVPGAPACHAFRTGVLVLALAMTGCATTLDAVGPLCPASVEAIDAAVAATMERGSPGMVVGVARDGDIVFSRGYGWANVERRTTVTPDTVFRLASITKQFTAAAVMLLVEEGRINLEDRLSEYVPELRHSHEVTVYQLLVQTSGIPDYAEDPIGMATKAMPRTTDEMIAWIAGLETRLQFEPGSRWSYSNSNYALLGAIVERVSGQTLSHFFNERLFAPARLADTALGDPVVTDASHASGYRRSSEAPSGFANADEISYTVPGAAGGLRTTSLDLLRWSDALFGGRVVNRASIAAMTAPGRLSDGRTTKLGMPDAWQAGLNADYGFGFFISPSAAGPRIWHAGDIDGFSTWMAHYPNVDVTIVLMENIQSVALPHGDIENAVFASLLNGCGI
jgi:CubicO group peptidase (beta-lactamase class C family)